jgi:subtilase family serine protease
MRINARVHRKAVAGACLAAALFAGGAGVATAATPGVTMPGSVADAVTSAPAVGAVPASQSLNVQLWLKGDDTAATAYADAVSNPTSKTYHQFLSPDAYTARFGASAASATAVRNWLTQQGFTNIKLDAQRTYLRATAPASTVQNAFGVQLKTYKVAGQSAPVMSNDRDITLPASIAGDVLGVSGLNNAQPKTELARRKPLPRPTTARTTTASTPSPACPPSTASPPSRRTSAATTARSCAPRTA